jgi:hypothetical protein
MRYKNYKNEIYESNFGIILDGENAGKFSYILMPEIKEVEIHGKFVPNEGFNEKLCFDNLNKEIESKRKSRYQNETDPLFFAYQRGSVTKEAWLNAIQAIKDELPYIE